MSARFGPAAIALYSLSVRLLGWKPATFWAATPAELIAALIPPDASVPLARDDLNRMMDNDHASLSE